MSSLFSGATYAAIIATAKGYILHFLIQATTKLDDRIPCPPKHLCTLKDMDGLLKRQVVDVQKTPSYCDFFGSVAMMNMCSKCQKDMILLKQEHAKLASASSKDVVSRSSSSNELELALVGAMVATADLASYISQVKSKEGLKKCTDCRKRMGLMW
ncbi:hypothetical protein CQW23_31289 [Capsicum baccatum]|uniref:A20-type domain-containing protein n=1 Tax=Capsicum baccatum TaxID=33114 RepID=A0A2G2V826_CAPBA|nr:hypothetical protein CQW23_31289 [Capsicum baccatum]